MACFYAAGWETLNDISIFWLCICSEIALVLMLNTII